MFRWTWEPPAAWRRALQEFSPRVDRLSWLDIHWVPGRPRSVEEPDAEPMQRWVIFECVPAFAVVPNAFLAGQLEKLLENPWGQAMHAWAAHYWLTHRALPTPYWVLQGPFGGHKLRYTNEESEFAMWMGHEGQPPAIGDLPYAELTPLTLQLIRTHAVMTDRRYATNDAARAAKVERLQREARRMLLHGMDESGLTTLVGEAAQTVHEERVWHDRRTVRPVDPRESEAAYIETGRFLSSH